MATTFSYKQRYKDRVTITTNPPAGEAAQDIRQNFIDLTDWVETVEGKTDTIEGRIEVVEDCLHWKTKE